MPTLYENETKALTASEFSDLIKKNVLAMCQIKERFEDITEKRKTLEAQLLNDMDLVLLKEQEQSLKEQVEASKADLEIMGLEYLKLLNEKKGSIFSDSGKISFKIAVDPIIKDPKAVIQYLVDSWLSDECLKPQEIKKKEFNAFATTQVGENQIPGIELIEVAKIAITTK